jgi:hypothetical protein
VRLVGQHSAQPRRGPSEMISDGCTDTNRKVLVEGVGENLLPTAQTWGFGRPCLPVAAPCTGNRHIDLFCDLRPGQALVTQLQNLLGGGGTRQRTARTHRDARLLQLFADRTPMNAQLGTDLAHGPIRRHSSPRCGRGDPQ